MRKYTHILFVIVLVASVLNSNAQINNALNVTRKEGLSDSNIKTICVDKFGYVWFGTAHGLNRYDGFETVSYYNDIDDKTTISDNLIKDVYEDFDGKIWVNVVGNINLFDRETDSFKRIKLPTNVGYRIIDEDSTFLWIKTTSNEKLWLYNKSSEEIVEESISVNNLDISPTGSYFNKVCNLDIDPIPIVPLLTIYKYCNHNITIKFSFHIYRVYICTKSMLNG